MAVEQSALRKTQQRIKDIIEVMFALTFRSLISLRKHLLHHTSRTLVCVSLLSMNRDLYTLLHVVLCLYWTINCLCCVHSVYDKLRLLLT
jgi:hypothetical protein